MKAGSRSISVTFWVTSFDCYISGLSHCNGSYGDRYPGAEAYGERENKNQDEEDFEEALFYL